MLMDKKMPMYKHYRCEWITKKKIKTKMSVEDNAQNRLF